MKWKQLKSTQHKETPRVANIQLFSSMDDKKKKSITQITDSHIPATILYYECQKPLWWWITFVTDCQDIFEWFPQSLLRLVISVTTGCQIQQLKTRVGKLLDKLFLCRVCRKRQQHTLAVANVSIKPSAIWADQSCGGSDGLPWRLMSA